MAKQEQSGWMLISEDGFGEQNAGRTKGHLVKELVQNGWDALNGVPGRVDLQICMTASNKMKVQCIDNGPGIENLDDLRTMFFTGKKDSPTSRGRFGRGFKEMLCLSLGARVLTNRGGINFVIEGGKRMVRRSIKRVENGTHVEMDMPWGEEEIEPMVEYFRAFLPPQNIDFYVNAEPIIYRQPTHRVSCTLTTEVFENSAWVKRRRGTTVEVVPTHDGEEPMLYEMGIPVCSVEWTAPFHVNVLQRIPMNPNRDAVMSGFIPRIHGELIQCVYPELPQEQLKEEWVGRAATYLSAEQKAELIRRAFGNNVARSVPAMSSQQRQFDSEAVQDGVQIVNTRHLSAGFREVFQEVVPTTRQVVEQKENERRTVAASSGVPLSHFANATRNENARNARQ